MKRVLKQLLPDKAYQLMAGAWRNRDWFKWVLKTGLERGWPKRLFFFGTSPGDDLLCTALLHELKARGNKKIWMMSNHPELFVGNRDATQIVPVDSCFRDYAIFVKAKYQRLEYAEVDYDRDLTVPPTRHIIAELCARGGVKGQISMRPYFYLTAMERKKAAWSDGLVAIQSSGLSGKHPMRNKQWLPERYQEVVNLLKSDFKFLQLGSKADPLLDGVIDLRGETSIRETAAVLANCRLYIGNVGFLMHLARAVECPSVIVFGGREAPWQSGYSCNVNLYSAEPCAPCWRWNKCDYDRVCMAHIAVSDVVDAVKNMLARSRQPLPVDYFTI